MAKQKHYTLIAFSLANAEDKERLSRIARREGINNSILLRRLVKQLFEQEDSKQ